MSDMSDMRDIYESWASEELSIANERSHVKMWQDAYEEMASELLTLARISR
jgi:hypothetical protein